MDSELEAMLAAKKAQLAQQAAQQQAPAVPSFSVAPLSDTAVADVKAAAEAKAAEVSQGRALLVAAASLVPQATGREEAW